MLHIFQKDLRRLWPAVLITLALLVELSRLDSWRKDWLASSAEGWLNLLLPLAWACLIALLVQQEPLVGDRHFWITWPYRWQALLASKALFVLVFIHVPVLLADATIMALHGFHPVEFAARLIWKQVLLAATVTAPALGLATLFENLAAFLLAAIVIGGAAAYLAGAYETLRTPWLPRDEIRGGLATCVLALTAVVIVLVQYARRRTTPSRIAGAGATVFAGLLLGYLPPTVIAKIRSTLHPTGSDITLRLLSTRPELPIDLETLPSRSGPDIVQVALPIAVSGISEIEDVHFNVLSAEIVAADAQRYGMPSYAARRNFEKVDFDASLFEYGQRPAWLVLRIRRSVNDKIKDGAVTIRAGFEVSVHHAGQTVWMPVGTTQTVDGAGRCSSAVIESPNVYQQSMLKVLCESPYPILPGTGIRLWQPETGAEWKQHLGDSAPYASGPRETFLSPLNRLQTFFHLVSDPRDKSPGSRWLVPRDALANAKLAITPNAITAWATADLELRNIRLRDYVLQRTRW
ncbi:MAG TPA: hypothetical protein VGL72_09970 [Bryobacteraceae bacterium]|jgi:hypothetical protein